MGELPPIDALTWHIIGLIMAVDIFIFVWSFRLKKIQGVAQPGRVLALEASCRRFKSFRPDQFTGEK